jgi:multiple sugar transport system substrate-binding protein
MAEEFPQVTVTPRTRSADPKLLSRRQVLRAAGGLGAVGAATLMSRHADAAPTRAPFVVRQRFQDQITIEVWDQQQSDKNIQDAYNAALTAFQEANPGVTVKVTTFPYAQYRDKLLVAVRGGTGPDVMSLDEIWTPEFAAAGVIEPLDDLIAASTAVKPEIFFQGAWDTNLYQGKIWGVPLNFDVWMQMYYNADMFTAAGLDPNAPPKTWDEWLTVAETLTKAPNQFGIGIIGHKGEDMTVMLNSLMYSNGGKVIDDEGKAVINSPENVETLTFFKNLAQYAPEGVANAGEAECVAAFVAGQVAMILDGSWQQDTMNAQAKFDWRIAVPPAPAGKSYVGALGGWNYAINKGSKNKEAAFKLIEYLSTQKEVQKTINSLTPAMREAGEEFVREKRKQPEVILETLNSGRPRPISPVYPQISDVEQNMVQAIWAGTPVEDALKDAQAQIEEILTQLG